MQGEKVNNRHEMLWNVKNRRGASDADSWDAQLLD